MYLYFDVNGNLKEIINYPVREGNDNVNKIYVYVEPSSNLVTKIDSEDYEDYDWESEPTEDSVNVFTLPNIFDTWEAVFKITNSDTILNPNNQGESIADSNIIKQIPFDKERDLKYFKYFKYYQFIVIILTSDITQYSGRCDCSVSLINTDPSRIEYLDTFSFFIQSSVVIKDVTITSAQYQYLYAEIKNIESGMVGQYVPYTGADDNVNLGSHHLAAKELIASGISLKDVTDDDETYSLITTGSTSLCLNPDGYLYYGSELPDNEVVVKGDLSDFVVSSDLSDYALTSDLGDYLPLAGGDMEGDINLGNYGVGFTGGSIYVDGNADMHVVSAGSIILNPDLKAYVYDATTDNEIAVKGNLPTQGLCASFSTSDFTLDTDHYVISNVAVSNFITGSNMLIITWDNCFALCPIPQTGAGRVCAAMWNADGESQIIRIKYELKTNNTLLDISLSGGFVPPSGHTAYVQCIKLF